MLLFRYGFALAVRLLWAAFGDFGCVVVFYGFICCGCDLFRGCGYLG